MHAEESGRRRIAALLVLAATAAALAVGPGRRGYAGEGPRGFSEPFIVAFYGLNPALRYDVNVTTYRDVDRDLSAYTTFAFDPSDVDNPLLEKELLRMVEERLRARGLARDEEQPQLLVTMSYFVGQRENYVPPKTITTTRIQQVWSTGMVGLTMTGQYTPVPVTETRTVPGKKVVSYYRNIRLNVFDYQRLQQRPKIPPLVWIGIVESEGSSSDIRDVAPVMLSELLAEYPKATGRSRHRLVQRVELGALGLLVNPEEWWRVAGVFPGSPAEAAGLRPGDRILRVDGERTVNGRHLLEHKGKAAYARKSPYYRKVLANLGRREVELLVKSAHRDPATGKKKRAVRLRPVHLVAHHYVNPATGQFAEWCPWDVHP